MIDTPKPNCAADSGLPATPCSAIFEVRGAYVLSAHSPKYATAAELAEVFLTMEAMSPTSEVLVRSGEWEFEDHWKPKWVPHQLPQNAKSVPPERSAPDA